MSFIKNFLSNQNQDSSKGWINLSKEDQIAEMHKVSFEKPVVIFKHSTRCGISVGAKSRLEEVEYDAKANYYYLDLLNHREISNKIAATFDVVHQSPQIIILKNGDAVWKTSHHDISGSGLLDALESVLSKN